jgi:hypothetical protein
MNRLSTPPFRPSAIPEDIEEHFRPYMPILERPPSAAMIHHVRASGGAGDLAEIRKEQIRGFEKALYGDMSKMEPLGSKCIFLNDDRRNMFHKVWDDFSLYAVGTTDHTNVAFRLFMDALIQCAKDEASLCEWGTAKDPRIDNMHKISEGFRNLQTEKNTIAQRLNMEYTAYAEQKMAEAQEVVDKLNGNPSHSLSESCLSTSVKGLWIENSMRILPSTDLRFRYFIHEARRHYEAICLMCNQVIKDEQAVVPEFRETPLSEEAPKLTPQPPPPLDPNLPADFQEAMQGMPIRLDGKISERIKTSGQQMAESQMPRREAKLKLYLKVMKGEAKMSRADIVLDPIAAQAFRDAWDRFDLEKIQDLDPTSAVLFNFITKLISRAEAELEMFRAVAEGRESIFVILKPSASQSAVDIREARKEVKAGMRRIVRRIL